jgi:hypothetical protein
MSRPWNSGREAFWRKLIAQQRSSRLTVRQACQRAGVSTAAFYAWRQRLKRPGRGSSSLVPVRIIQNRNNGDGAKAARGSDWRQSGRTALDHPDRKEIIVELREAALGTPAVQVRIPPGCDEESIRRVLRAVMAEREGGSASC